MFEKRPQILGISQILITSVSEIIPLICVICVREKTTDIRDLTDVNHERKRDNPFNLCSDKKLCDLAALRLKKGNGFIWFLFLQDTNNNLSRIIRIFEILGIKNKNSR